MPSPIFVIGNHHLGRCLHFCTMATFLKEGEIIPLNLTWGKILVLKASPGKVSTSTISGESTFAFKLFNETGDILIYIVFSRRGITFKDYARRSLGDGWGKAHTVDMTVQSMHGVTVSIHHYPTDSKFGRYQILLNGITIYHFDKRLPGPARRISYAIVDGDGSVPRSWDVDVYQIDDLLPEDQLALVQGG